MGCKFGRGGVCFGTVVIESSSVTAEKRGRRRKKKTDARDPAVSEKREENAGALRS